MSILDKLSAIEHPLKIAQAAKLLGLHPMTVYKWTRSGKLPHLRLGGAIRIDPHALAQWVSNRQLS